MATNELNIPGRVPNSDNVVFSSFYGDNHITQNSFIVHPKTVIVDLLRREFSQDSLYTYRSDEYGFPLVRDLTGIDMESDLTTKILISEQHRYEMKFFPNVVIGSKGGSYKPLAANQNQTIKYRRDAFVNNFGEKFEVSTPTHKVYAGMWDHSIEIAISTESHVETEEITEIVALMVQFKLFHELRAAGIIVKNLSVGGESSEKYANDFIFTQTITIGCISEWRAELPIDNLVEKIALNLTSVKTPSDYHSTIDQRFSDVVTIAEFYDFKDVDYDGIEDRNELSLGTERYVADTDGDDYYDGDEIARGSDPTDPLSIPD